MAQGVRAMLGTVLSDIQVQAARAVSPIPVHPGLP